MRRRALALLLAEVRALRLRVKRLLRRAGAHRPDYYRDALLHRVSARQLEAFFRRLGLREGMLVYLQSSYGGIGHFSGGPRGLLEILCRIVGPEGTLVLPSFPTSTSMFDYAAAAPVFDVARTPSRIGLLPEVFRTMPGVLRSLHPTHPVCAWGARAGEIVADHELCATPQQPGSPFGKMVAGGGHILRIGTRANPLTHTMQEMAEWPNLFVPGAPATLDCIDREGRRVQVTTRIYRPGLPYVLFLEDPVTGAPLRANIMHFPYVTQHAIDRGDVGGRALEVLLGMRRRDEARGLLRIARLHRAECDLYPMRESMDLSVAEARRVVAKFAELYEPGALQRRLAAGDA